jgi:hypothetical protein
MDAELPWQARGFLYKLPLAFRVVDNDVIEPSLQAHARPELGSTRTVEGRFFKKLQENYSAK